MLRLRRMPSRLRLNPTTASHWPLKTRRFDSLHDCSPLCLALSTIALLSVGLSEWHWFTFGLRYILSTDRRELTPTGGIVTLRVGCLRVSLSYIPCKQLNSTFYWWWHFSVLLWHSQLFDFISSQELRSLVWHYVLLQWLLALCVLVWLLPSAFLCHTFDCLSAICVSLIYSFYCINDLYLYLYILPML